MITASSRILRRPFFSQLLKPFFPVVFWLLAVSALRAAEYQWSATIEATKAGSPPQICRAFLWIPPACPRVRAVVVGEHNMLEEVIFDSPIFRQTMADLGFAIIWISPSFDHVFQPEGEAWPRLAGLLKTLAQQSGYQELEFAPVVPLGHSAHATFPWNLAAGKPERTLAILSVKGDAPQTDRTGYGGANADWGTHNIDGVPGLMVMGEYEWRQDRLDPIFAFQKKYPAAPVSMLADPGEGHFDASDALISYLGLFLRKAAQARLPAEAPLDGPVKLQPVDPKKGWLIDQWQHGQPRLAPAAPFADYKGDRATSFWCFDQEIALATERFNDQRGRKPQLLGFEQEGEVLAQNGKTHQQVSLKFQPLEDGVSFRFKGVFIETVPEGNPTWWTGLPAGAAIGHATGGGPVLVSKIAGPVAAAGPDTWTIRFYRGAEVTDLSQKKEDLWFHARQSGDNHYKAAVQQTLLTIPARNTDGADQHLTFPEIPDQTNSTAFLKLAATSDAGGPVSYYVREGPAEIEGHTLRFTAIPPRAKYPIQVTVVAWQWGRATEPKMKSAEPIVRTFQIVAGPAARP